MEQNRPAYPIGSVDHALRLAVLLQEAGALRVSEAAEALDVARSTAHRLLAMLVYRGFALQDEDRRYRPGPVISAEGVARLGTTRLRTVALPRMRALAAETGETANLMVLLGIEVEFIASAEGHKVLRVGSRVGRRLPAHLASGGRVLLAAIPNDEVRARYARTPVAEVDALAAELTRVRERGFAVNDQMTERGVTAIGVPVPHANAPAAALALAIPSARFDAMDLDAHLQALRSAATAIGDSVVGTGADTGE